MALPAAEFANFKGLFFASICDAIQRPLELVTS